MHSFLPAFVPLVNDGASSCHYNSGCIDFDWFLARVDEIQRLENTHPIVRMIQVLPRSFSSCR